MARSTFDGLTGAAAGLGGVSAAEVVTAVSGGPSLLDAAGRLVVDLGPRPVIDVAVRLLRTSDKPAIRAAVVGTVVAAGSLAARSANRSASRAAVLGLAGGLAAWAGLRRPPRRPVSTAAATAVGGLTAAAILRSAPSAGTVATTATIAAGGLWWARRRRDRHEQQFDAAVADRVARASTLPAVRDGAESWPGVVPLITPTSDFYRVDVSVATPLIDPRTWRLRMFGTVQRPAEWDLDSLASLGVEEFDAVMVCIHYQLGWRRVGNARWTGVPLRTLLDRVGVADRAHNLVTRSVDNFAISLPLDVIDQRGGYVVTGMNGGPLPAGHGFPARVFVPGIYGQYTGVKWLSELEVTDGPHADYWAQRGWPREPVAVRPMSRIDAPRDGAKVEGAFSVAGVAWAPPDGLSRVEVAVDDDDWREAEMADELAPAAWRRWRYPVDVPAGVHRLRSRAVARDGTVQEAMPRPPFPSGVSGYQTVQVQVVDHRGNRTS
jgi:DMSO/TMAO reductase YedYZ molybdopterin-dependent catalytic subunit